MSTTKTIPEIRSAMRQKQHAMIGNMLFGPIEAIPLKHTDTKLNFRTVGTDKTVSFNRADLGESVFVEYFIPETTPTPAKRPGMRL